jgi:hypothetical protein
MELPMSRIMKVVSLIVSFKSRRNDQANTYLLTEYYSAAFYQSLQDVFPNQDFQDLTDGQECGQSNEQTMQEALTTNSFQATSQQCLYNPLPARMCGSAQIQQAQKITMLSSSIFHHCYRIKIINLISEISQTRSRLQKHLLR